ncbi:MAG TPA: sigma-70 family RNA polymerase sigma factor [Acidimicrobiales bacterium]|nr:sigma-70 family RNA polymerase sigma factor [Acidimicrobiales bacterium]
MAERKRGRGDLEGLFREHYASLLRLARVLTGDDELAEDIAQDAFMRLDASISWPAAGAELAYLRRTVVNLSHDHFRRRLVVRRHIRSTRDDAGDLTGPAALDRSQQVRVAAAVRALPRRQRDCVVLRYYSGCSDAEVAELLEIGIGSVKSSIARARARLARELKDLR